MKTEFIYQIENRILICGITIGENSIRHTVRGWHDGLSELLNIACKIFEKFEEETAYFQEEPGTYLWRISRLESNRIRVRIVEYKYDWWASPRSDDPGELLFDHPCGAVSFAKAIETRSAEWITALELSGEDDEAGKLRESKNRLSSILKKFDYSDRS